MAHFLPDESFLHRTGIVHPEKGTLFPALVDDVHLLPLVSEVIRLLIPVVG
jgi:hypothetical protein